MKFTVPVKFNAVSYFEVDADNAEEAEEKVEAMLRSEDTVPSPMERIIEQLAAGIPGDLASDVWVEGFDRQHRKRKYIMSRRTVRCDMKHTPLSPHKNRVRTNWMWDVSRSKDIITISHGILDMVMALRFISRIQICDINPGVRETTRYLAGRGRCNSRPTEMDYKPSDYPDLNILEPGCDILSTVREYCKNYGTEDLGAVDVDLPYTIKPAWEVLRPVLNVLRSYGYQGKVLVTFTYRRDGFKSIEARIKWLRARLRGRAKLVVYEQYHSGGVSDYGSRHGGSTMCIVELWMGAQSMKKAA